jgi:hypothetical protein
MLGTPLLNLPSIRAKSNRTADVKRNIANAAESDKLRVARKKKPVPNNRDGLFCLKAL